MSLPKSVSLSFLDLMTCGFGGVIIIFLVLITFFNSDEQDVSDISLLTADNTYSAPLVIVVECDHPEGSPKIPIWEDFDQLSSILDDTMLAAGTSETRLVICAADSSSANVKVDRLATNVAIKIAFYEGRKSMIWSGLYADWPGTAVGQPTAGKPGLQLWPLPDSLRETFQ